MDYISHLIGIDLVKYFLFLPYVPSLIYKADIIKGEGIMACVISIGACKKSFSLEEANHILPVITKISHKHSFRSEPIISKDRNIW